VEDDLFDRIVQGVRVEEDGFDLLALREGVDFEAKAAQGRSGDGELPGSFWQTYSAMANTEGGSVLLGAREEADHGLTIIGLREGSVTNVRLREISGQHPVEVTKRLRALVDQGLLGQFGATRGTFYRLVEGRSTAPERAGRVGVESGAESGAESLLAPLVQGELSASAWARACSATGVTGAFKRSLRRVMDQGLVERTVPEKPQSRLQRYRLTQAGRAWLASRGGARGST